MRYILDYLKEEVGIQPIENAKVTLVEEYANSDCPGVGRRLVINDKETDIVVWYADYDEWLENKYVEILKKLNKDGY